MNVRLWVMFFDLIYSLVDVATYLVYGIPFGFAIWWVMRLVHSWRLGQIQLEASRNHQQLDIVERKLKLAFIAHPQASDLKELDMLLDGLFEQKRLGAGEEDLFINASQVARKINGMCKVQERITQAKGRVREILLTGDER